MKTMSKLRLQVLLIGLLTITANFAQDSNMPVQSWSFDDHPLGQLPPAFSALVGTWRIETDETAPSKSRVLLQAAESPKPTYNVVLLTNTDAKDVDLSVKLRPLAGKTDQGGGVVWRAKDGANYYIARYNPLEENFRVYKVEDGKRTQLQSADIPRSEAWHTLRVTMKADHIQCFFDGAPHLDVKDTTFSGSGHIGLWTKADAQTHFDDLTLTTP